MVCILNLLAKDKNLLCTLTFGFPLLRQEKRSKRNKKANLAKKAASVL